MISDEEIETLNCMKGSGMHRVLERLRSAEDALRFYAEGGGHLNNDDAVIGDDGYWKGRKARAHFEKVKGGEPSCGSDFEGDDV